MPSRSTLVTAGLSALVLVLIAATALWAYRAIADGPSASTERSEAIVEAIDEAFQRQREADAQRDAALVAAIGRQDGSIEVLAEGSERASADAADALAAYLALRDAPRAPLPAPDALTHHANAVALRRYRSGGGPPIVHDGRPVLGAAGGR